MVHSPDCQTSCYSLEIQEAIAVIRFTGDIYELGTCLHQKADFFAKLKSLNNSPKIKALLISNAPGVLGDENYCRFISTAIQTKISGKVQHNHAAPYRECRIMFERQTNAINQFVREMLNFRKLIIVGFEGDVAPPFFGAGLIADYRFGTDEMTFHPSHIKLEIVPGGGLGFTLPMFIGHTRSRDLLFSDRPTSASDLSRLELLDGHFPEDDFQDKCIEIAKELAAIPLPAIEGIKSVIKPFARDLMDFLKYEEKTLDCLIARKRLTP